MNKRFRFTLHLQAVFLLGTLALLGAGQAQATLLANTQITNTVTVNYSDVSNTAAYSATDTITVIVAETYSFMWENYSPGFDENGGATIATAANTSPQIYADLFNRGNVLDTGVTLALANIYGGLVTATGVPIGAILCQGDGTVDTTGTVGDDMTCAGAATGAHTIFAYGITSCLDNTPGAGHVQYTLTEDVTGGAVALGDLVSLDNSSTGISYEVTAVSLAGGAGTDTISIFDNNTIDCSGPTLLQEVQRYALTGELPYNTDTGGIPDQTHADVSWQLTATDTGTNAYSTAADGVDDRAGTDLAVAVLGAEIDITKYTMVVDSANNVMTTPALTLSGCGTTEVGYTPGVGTGVETWYSDATGTCQVDGVPSDGSIYYWLRLNNAGAKTASTGSNCVADPDTGQNGAHNGPATDTCAGSASFVAVADDYPELLTALDIVGANAPFIDSNCDGTADVQVGAATELITCLTGQICESPAGTLNYYLGTGADETSGTPGGTLAKSAGAAIANGICLVYHVTLN